jgi:nucleotide-binding universal stress UspA family protein
MKILAATDGSQQSDAALRAASRLLASEDRRIDVLYVSPKPPRSKAGERARQAFRTNLAAEAQRILHNAEMVLKEEGVMAATRSECGSPSGVIMRLAEDYDLVVIGAKGREVQPGIGLGPVASRIVEHANGYVFVGREPPTDRQARVLAAVDGSAGSEHALDALISLFDLENSEITLLHVIETLWLPENREEEALSAADTDFEQADQVRAELRREADQLLADARLRITSHHTAVTSIIREGIPANEILSEADQGGYDVIVVGANEANDLKRGMLGSVSSKVAWNAPCSVLIVRVPE